MQSLSVVRLAVLGALLFNVYGTPNETWAKPKAGSKAGATATTAPDKSDPKDRGDRNDRYENLELFQKVLHFVETNYVEETKNRDLVYGAIKGMLETLDPHSNFLTEDIFGEMKTETSGKFGGIGIEIGLVDNVLTVIAPIEDTPAWKAGIKARDRIVKINGESTKGYTLSEALQKMRGKKGSEVKLSIYREGLDSVKELGVVRDLIKIQSVKSEPLEAGWGYIRLTSFNENAGADVKAAIEKMEKSGGKLRGLVFDLRNNPGGLLDQAVEVASIFIDDGVIVSTIGRNKDQKEIKYARKGPARKDLDIAVLVNSSTASAAEIVAGALQDHQRAIILGQPTFGKGSVQTVIDLGKNVGLKLTIARYYTPSGRSIQEKGVSPDIALDDYDTKLLAEAKRKSDSYRERDLKGHMINEDGEDEGATGNPKGTKGKHEEFKKEELSSLGKKKKSNSANPKDADSEKDNDEFTPTRIEPKEDFQVREALNLLKSHEVFKRLEKKTATQ